MPILSVRTASFFPVLLALGLSSACSCGRARPEGTEVPHAAAPPETVDQTTRPEPVAESTESAPAAALVPRVETPRFTVTAESVGARYARGRSGKIAFEIAAADGYSIHSTLPLHVSVRAPSGMGVEQSSFERADATVSTPTRARFEVPVRPTQTGEANVDALVRFAICQGDVCEPRDERVMLSLTVE